MTGFLVILKQRNEALFYFGLLCLIGAGLCVFLLTGTRTTVAGVRNWYKPLKFLLSTACFVWTMGWIMAYLPSQTQVVRYSWGIIILFAFENLYIAWQASRGQPSHFNTNTPFYAAMWAMMGIAATAISVWTAIVGIAFFTERFPDLIPAYLWGIRLGLCFFILFSMQGLLMGSRMAHTVGGADGGAGVPVLNWSTQHGDLRIAHFLGMHALQIMPLLGYYMISSVPRLLITGIVYLTITLAVLSQALAGRPLFKGKPAILMHKP